MDKKERWRYYEREAYKVSGDTGYRFRDFMEHQGDFDGEISPEYLFSILLNQDETQQGVDVGLTELLSKPTVT